MTGHEVRELKVLEEVMLLAADTGRSRAYLDIMRNAGLLPSTALVLDCVGPVRVATKSTGTDLFDNRTSLPDALHRAAVPFSTVSADSVNDGAVVDSLVQCRQPYVIYSGPPGALLKKPLFDTGKRFLHVHPGRLPDFRGSTPMYYSLLAEGSLCATALFLDLEIDTGEVIAMKNYDPPPDPSTIDTDFDPWMRADLLADVLAEYEATGTFERKPQPVSGVGAYYIIHPVLKHLAMMRAMQ